jgi:hypothetical protein
VRVDVDYKPVGRDRFECEVSLGVALSLTVSGSLEDTTPATHGSVELASNGALVSNAWAYAKHEAFRRRLRSAEKRESHEKQAQQHKRACVVIAEMVSKTTQDSREGWCSACFSSASHRRVRGFGGPVDSYLCEACGTPTTECAGPRCGNLANRGISGITKPSYCAEHRHQIPSFEKLTVTVGSIDEWGDWLSFDKRNLTRATKVAGAVLLTGAAVTPVAWAAAPAIGGALGGLTGLSGAAAASHGLAMLGGGSLAAGGLGMAGGTAVVAAVGGGIGGALGGSAAAAYVGADPSFGVKKVRDGVGAPVLLASGFLTQGADSWGAWQRLIDQRYPERPVYRVNWGAKELKTLGLLAAAGAGKAGAMKFAKLAAGKAAKKAAHQANFLGWIGFAKDMAANPWSVAKTRAGMTGVVLAELIARTEGTSVVLVGHSLGARVMVTAAQLLGTTAGAPRIEDIHLLGAAVGASGDWRTLDDSVDGKVWNYWSRNDAVLKYLYAVASTEKAAGQAGFVTRFPSIKNRDVSRLVPKHSAYFDCIELVGRPGEGTNSGTS